jgi:hypothetical protein
MKKRKRFDTIKPSEKKRAETLQSRRVLTLTKKMPVAMMNFLNNRLKYLLSAKAKKLENLKKSLYRIHNDIDKILSWEDELKR